MGTQDIRFVSIVIYNLPLVRLIFNCSVISLCGIPFLSGFFSKDLILEIYLINSYNKFILIILFISMGLTIIYSFRLIYYSFIKIPQLIIYYNYYRIINFIGISIYLLFLISIVKGLILRWVLFSIKNVIYLPIMFKLIIYGVLLIGILIGINLPIIFIKKKYFIYCNNYLKFFIILWFMPILYRIWNFSVLKISNKIIYYMDLGWIEYLTIVWDLKLLKNLFNLDFFSKNYFYLIILFLIIIILLIF